MSFLFGRDETTLDTNKIKYYINEFKKSNKYKWMHLGQIIKTKTKQIID